MEREEDSTRAHGAFEARGDAFLICINLKAAACLSSRLATEGAATHTGGLFLLVTIFIFFCNLFCCLLN